MSEINKLRIRIKNANPKSELRMSISDAKLLLDEIDELVNQHTNPAQEPPTVQDPEPTAQFVLFGGKF